MDIRVLGPVEASAGGKPVFIGAGKPRALLALLALNAGSTISTDRLVEGLWGEEPPATAAKMVQLYVSQLRKALADDGDGAEIVTRGRGYELRLGDGELDARRFERLVAAGAARDALSLWRGAPLADVADEPFAAAEIRRLEELRVAALELAIDGDLAAGRHREVVGELDALVAEQPLRERLHAQRMLALYRCGRQAEALEAYRQARPVLVEEIGVEPGPELRRLHEAILRQDPALDPPAADAVELPPELDAGTPLAGREAELDGCASTGARAHGGAGRLVLIAGARGIGKTRLAAELGGEVHRDGGAVLYASGAGAPETALAALASARVARRPTLLVLDDVDRAGEEVSTALGELVGALAALPVLVVATAEDPGLAAGLRADATLALAPLDADGVRAIARLYAGEREDADVPVERLAEASGGVPQRVHRAAGEWARTQAVRRSTRHAPAARGRARGLRAAEDDLVGQRRRAAGGARTRRVRPVEADGVVACPFKGLASFDVDDAEVFFGRERLVAELVARLVGAPLLGVVGPSGSGKSSALRAGLLAALAAGVLPGSERWALALMRPGEHPLRALEQATAEAAPRGRLVLAVDQFEEAVHRLPRRGRARGVRRRARRVARATRGAARSCWSRSAPTSTAAAPPTRSCRGCSAPTTCWSGRCAATSCAARSSCPRGAPACASSPSWPTRWSPTSRASPARCRCSRPRCSSSGSGATAGGCASSAYEQAGGVRGAVARLAETRLRAARPASGREVARAILLRLAGEGEGDGRRAPRACRWPSSTASRRGRASWRRSPTTGCVTIGDGEVEVAHEALLREWPRLRGWLEEDAEGRRLHRAPPRRRARLGRRRARPRRAVSRARLAAALEWAARPRAGAQRRERAFLDESRAATEREAERQRRVEPAPARAARRRRRAARAGRRRGRRRRSHSAARRATRRSPPTPSASAPRRSATTASTTRCCSRARASSSTTRPQTRGNLLVGAAAQPGGDRRGAGRRLAVACGGRQPRRAAHRARRRARHRHGLRPRDPTTAGPVPASDGGFVQPTCASRRTGPDARGSQSGSAERPGGARVTSSILLTGRRRLRIIPPRFPRESELHRGGARRSRRTGATWRSRSSTMPSNPDGPASVLRRFDGTTGASRGGPFGWADTQRPACPRRPIGGACS